MSTTAGTLRWTLTALALAVVAVVTLMVIGEVYGGTDVTLGATVDGEPAVDQLVGPQSGADVRNASVVLGLLALGVAIATYFYWRHTGHAARRRFAAQREASQPAGAPTVQVGSGPRRVGNAH